MSEREPSYSFEKKGTLNSQYLTEGMRVAMMSLLLLTHCSKTSESTEGPIPSASEVAAKNSAPKPVSSDSIPAAAPIASFAPIASPAISVASAASEAAAPPPLPKSGATCPSDMVQITNLYCIDRFESAVINPATDTQLSPYYPPSRWRAQERYKYYVEPTEEILAEDLDAGIDRTTKIEMPFPQLPDWQKNTYYSTKAVSRKGMIPNAYTSYKMAKKNCEAAGKRLCTADEWRAACMGEKSTLFPYGNTFQEGTCNTGKKGTPSVTLYDQAGVHLTDPRFNQLNDIYDHPLLERTGSHKQCASPWGNDAVYDMVGNLAEWVEDGRTGIRGTFMGGFYALSSNYGCDKKESAHGKFYFDYSIGARCCMDLPERVEITVPSASAPHQ